MKDCPCGSNFPYTDCCAPLIRGAVPADTAEDLMRSRYTATVLNDHDYLERTLHPDERTGEAQKPEGGSQRSWRGLEITGKSKGEHDDAEGEVRFIARYEEGGEERSLQEASHFVKIDGRWFYSEKRSQVSLPPPKKHKTVVREGAKVGRNDPCPCSSGKKFKKCCGR